MAFEMQQHTTTLQSRDKQMPVTTFIRDTFFPEVETYTTEDVVVEYSKGGQTVAPFVAPNVGGINIGRDGYVARRYTTPRIAPQRPISPEILKQRMQGENIHSTMTEEDRAKKILEKDAKQMDDQITRREELMAAQLLTTGAVEVKGYLDDNQEKYVDDSVDYKHTQRIICTGTDAWTDPASKPYDDLGTGCEMVMKSGYDPKYAILGVESYKKLLEDETFLKKLDISNLAIARIAPTLQITSGSGVKYLGHISEFGIDLFTYYAWYYNKGLGTQVPYIPGNKVAIAPEKIGGFLYGAITQMEKDEELHTYEGTRVPKQWARVESDTKMLRISSRPLVKPDDVDCWTIIDAF